MNSKGNILRRIYDFYADGFRQMTTGRTLWAVIIIKLFIIFAVLKVFFFPDFLKSNAEEGGEPDFVAKEMIERMCQNGDSQPLENNNGDLLTIVGTHSCICPQQCPYYYNNVTIADRYKNVSLQADDFISIQQSGENICYVYKQSAGFIPPRPHGGRDAQMPDLQI